MVMKTMNIISETEKPINYVDKLWLLNAEKCEFWSFKNQSNILKLFTKLSLAQGYKYRAPSQDQTHYTVVIINQTSLLTWGKSWKFLKLSIINFWLVFFLSSYSCCFYCNSVFIKQAVCCMVMEINVLIHILYPWEFIWYGQCLIDCDKRNIRWKKKIVRKN